MKTKNEQTEIAQSAPLVASGVLGADFWDEVQRLVEAGEPTAEPKVTPRPGVTER